MNTPPLTTDRLNLRRFSAGDIEALFAIYSDGEVNRFLPWFPLKTLAEAERLYEDKYARFYLNPEGCRYAICLKEDNRPIGYVHVAADDSHDLGYALCRPFWNRGLATEACRAVVGQLKQDGVPYVTATHDILNPRSGKVMQRLGMRYCYSYEENWQPKNIPVIFRLYQLNLDGQNGRVYRKYWEQSLVRMVETAL